MEFILKIVLDFRYIGRHDIVALACCGFLASCSGGFQEHNLVAETKNPNGRNDAWGFVGYGGGGAMFYPSVSPHNTDFALVACDMTGSFVTTNGGDSWRMFNLRGPVDYFVFDPQDSNTVYANSIALFRSKDRGTTWALFYPAPSEIKGVVSKGDHASEVVVTKDGTRRDVLAFAVDPHDSKKLYAAVAIEKAAALYFSADGGAHWSKETELPDDAKNIFVVPSSPRDRRIVYVAGNHSIAAKENGKWKINPGPERTRRITTYSGGYDQKEDKFIIYGISGKSYFNPEGDVSGIYYSENGGETWENREKGLMKYLLPGAEVPEWRTIATSALHPEVVYVSYNNLRVHADTTCIGVAKSSDYGNSWELSWKDILTSGENLAAGNFTGGWINERFGPTWGENPFSIGVSATDPQVCYGTDFGRTVKTEDGGKTWAQVYTKEKTGGGSASRGLEVTTGYQIISDPFDQQRVFIANTDVGLMESDDGGESWRSATFRNGVPRAWANSTYWLAFDPEVQGRAWAAMSGTHDLPRPKMFRTNGTKGYEGGILLTEDGGKMWKPVSRDIGEAAMTHILIDDNSDPRSRILYACAFGKGVYKSIDGGKTWTRKNLGIAGSEPFAWRISKRAHDGALFLVVTRRSEDGSIGNDGDGALYRSDNGAERWSKVSLPSQTNGPMSIVSDPDEGSRLLLSAWGRATHEKFSSDIGGGIFLSKDDGKTWIPVLEGDQHIHDITFDPRNKRYYACGFNGSAYRSDDRGETWNRIRGYNFKWGKRVDPDPRDPEKIFVITFGGGVWHGPAQGDAGAAEDIIPPLPLATENESSKK